MSNSFFKGFLLGSIVAGATALLTTPRNGKENRALVTDYIEDTTGLVVDVKDNVSSLQEAISTLSTEGVALVKDFSEDIHVTMKEFSHEITQHIRRIKEDSEKLQEDISTITDKTK